MTENFPNVGKEKKYPDQEANSKETHTKTHCNYIVKS